MEDLVESGPVFPSAGALPNQRGVRGKDHTLSHTAIPLPTDLPIVELREGRLIAEEEGGGAQDAVPCSASRPGYSLLRHPSGPLKCINRINVFLLLREKIYNLANAKKKLTLKKKCIFTPKRKQMLLLGFEHTLSRSNKQACAHTCKVK